jgi:hypothetical protein
MRTFSQHSNKHVRRNQFTKHDRVGFMMGIIGAIGLILFCYHYGYVDSQIQPLPSHSQMSRDITIACHICHVPAPIKSAKQAARIFHNRPRVTDKAAMEEIERLRYLDQVLSGGKL